MLRNATANVTYLRHAAKLHFRVQNAHVAELGWLMGLCCVGPRLWVH